MKRRIRKAIVIVRFQLGKAGSIVPRHLLGEPLMTMQDLTRPNPFSNKTYFFCFVSFLFFDGEGWWVQDKFSLFSVSSVP